LNYRNIAVKLSLMARLLGIILLPVALLADTWNPVPPAQIPGSAPESTFGTFPSYSPTLGKFLVTWAARTTLLPFYTTFDGTTWGTPAQIPGSSGAENEVRSSFSSTLGKFLVTWVDKNTFLPTYATFDGTTWSAPVPIPGSVSADLFSPIASSFDLVLGEFLVTWGDLNTALPFYATFNGTTWSTPAAIPGSMTEIPASGTLPTAGSGQFLVTYIDDASSIPTYTVFNGTSWTTPTAIPGSGTVMFQAYAYSCYDPAIGLFFVAWQDQATLRPYYALFNGATWTTPIPIPGSGQILLNAFSSFGTNSDKILVTWLNEPGNIPFYALFDGTTWSTPTTIPSSAAAPHAPYSAASPTLFLATWRESSPFDPVYSTLTLPPPTVPITATSGQNRSVLQKELFNVITWTAPTGVPWTPVLYLLYRDAGLTELVGSVPASGPLLIVDHNVQCGIPYTYYLVAIDTLSVPHLLGNATVTASCGN
jgi:hypothetical protein